MPEKHVYVDGVATFLRHTGRTSLPDEPPDTTRGEMVVCLHSALWSSASFDALLTALAGAHSPLAFDLPGHGRSGGLDSLGSVERMADHARALAGKLALRPAVWVGHGLGAAVAIELALRHPEAVRGLVLLDAAARPAIDPELLARVRRVTEGKERRFFRRELYAPDASREVLGAGFAEDMKTDPRVVYGDLLALSEWSAESRAADVACPARILVGGDAPAEAREAARSLRSQIPGARADEIPGAGRQLPLERPDALAEAVLGFLRELAS